MRIPFLRKPRPNELDGVLEQIDQLYRDISDLEQVVGGGADDAPGAGGFSAVQQLREVMARDDLTAKRAELSELLDKAASLKGEPLAAARPTRVAPPIDRTRDRGATAMEAPPTVEPPAAARVPDVAARPTPDEADAFAPTVQLPEEELRRQLAAQPPDTDVTPRVAASTEAEPSIAPTVQLSEAEMRQVQIEAERPTAEPQEPEQAEWRRRRTEPRVRWLGRERREEPLEPAVVEPATPAPAPSAPSAPAQPMESVPVRAMPAAAELAAPAAPRPVLSAADIEQDLPEAIILAAIQLRRQTTQAREEIMSLEQSARDLVAAGGAAEGDGDIYSFRRSMVQEELATKHAELETLIRQSKELETHIARQAPKAYSVVVQRAQSEEPARGRGPTVAPERPGAGPSLLGALGAGVSLTIGRFVAATRRPGVRPTRTRRRRRTGAPVGLVLLGVVVAVVGAAVVVSNVVGPRFADGLLPGVPGVMPEDGEAPVIGAVDPFQTEPEATPPEIAEGPTTVVGFVTRMSPIDVLLLATWIGFVVVGAVTGLIRQGFGALATAVAIAAGGPVAWWASYWTGAFSTFGQVRALPLTYGATVIGAAVLLFVISWRSYPETRFGLSVTFDRIGGGVVGFVLGLIWTAELAGILILSTEDTWVMMDATRVFIRQQLHATPFLPLLADTFGLVTSTIRALLPLPLPESCARCL